MNSFLNNKNAFVLAFDEVIGKDTDFEGNTEERSIRETKIIMEYIIDNNIYGEDVSLNDLKFLYNIIEKTIAFDDLSIIEENNTYFLAGWYKHAIFIFYEKNNDENNTYTFGFINAGQGSNFQGMDNNLVNGIVLFKEVSFQTIYEFFEKYKLFLTNSNVASKRLSYSYHGFYAIIYDVFNTDKELYGISENAITNLKNKILKNKILKNISINFKNKNYFDISFIKIRPQIIGSCCFTNHISYLAYLLYKKDSLNYLDYFDAWYLKAKKFMCFCLYDEMKIENKVKYFNELNYINDLYNYKKISSIKMLNIPKIKTIIELDNSSSNSLYFSEEELRNFIHKNFIKFVNFTEILINFVKKKEITKEDFDNIYKTTNGLVFIFSFIFHYHKFNLSYDYIFDLYIIKKLIINNYNSSSDIHNFVFIFLQFFDFNKNKSFFHDKTKDDLSKKISVLLFYNILFIKEDIIEFYPKDDIIVLKQNKDTYASILMNLPITHYKYINVIKEIIEEINYYINYYPNITMDNSYNVIHKYYSSDINNNNNNINNKSYYNILILFEKFKLYTFPSSYDIDNNKYINNYNNMISRFIQSDDILSDIGTDNFIFETIGIINQNKNRVINKDNIYLENFKDSNIINTGNYDSYLSKINLLKPYIEKKLDEENTINISNYIIIYFYICELENTEINPIYINKYDDVITKKLQDLTSNKFFFVLIQSYCLKYNKSILIDKIEEKIDTIEYIIPKTEKIFFNEKKYTVSKCDNNNKKISYYEGIINFYIINYSCNIESNNFTFSKKLLIYRKDDSSDTSILIIKKLLKKYNILYIAINFTFYNDKNNSFIGIDKNDNSNKIYWNKNEDEFYYVNTKDSKKKFNIIKRKELRDPYYEAFYNTMMLNDPNLLLLQDFDNQHIFFLKSNLYDIEFEFNNNIYCLINSVRYEVLFDDGKDTCFNYGIFNLYNNRERKILCFYNIQNLFYYDYFQYKSYTYTNLKNESMEYSDIKLKNLESYYVLINMFDENTLILKNENDVMALLLNCFIYNNPNLILKSIVQIKTIIHNSNIDEKLLKLMFLKSKNIYSLFIYSVLFNDIPLYNYNYNFYKIILKKYNYNFEIKNLINISNFSYISFKVLYASNLINISSINDMVIQLIKLFKFEILDIDVCENFALNHKTYLNNLSIINYKNFQINFINNSKDKFKINIICNSNEILSLNYNINSEITYDKIKHLENNITNYNLSTVDEFEILLKKNISNFDKEKFNKNITVAENLFNYLINNDDDTLYPIQELIMGSGKSSVITPYTIILLYNHFIKYEMFNSKIYIVVPEFLLNQTFETIMLNVQPICFEIDIILFQPDYEKQYNNSISLIIISDKDLKEEFLTNKINDTNSYFIYDEVDTIANPLTNELNIPINDSKKTLLNINIIYELTKIIYSIFNDNTFWDIEIIKNNNICNNKHKYLIGITEEILNIINDKIQIYIDMLKITYVNNIKNIDKLFEYFKKNIITYIFTKQFNYDYGLPLNYDSIISLLDEEYKYKAIPYLGGDSPLYGSSFSDPILSYVLTYFSYKLLYPNIRIIDIENILYIDSNRFDELKYYFFNKLPNSINDYNDSKLYYLSNLKNVYELDDYLFEFYIKNILDKNISYYEICDNISFTDLLLKKNVKNYVGFTGTAYIQLPEEKNIVYFNNEYITKSENELGQTVEATIESIIIDNTKMRKFYKNKDNSSLMENIFECITDYDVLIDIGAVFINVSNDEFINKYNKLIDKKKYLVYFNNGIKVYNTNTNQYENVNSINKENKNTFFYFSNKNITGVDAKKFMDEEAKALVTISINTILRDFSQGIFRMRNIQDSQSFDLLIDYKMINIYSKNGKQFGGNCFENIHINDRNNIFKLLKENQYRLDKSKIKILLKQNILGIVKNSISESKCYLYQDPQDNNYENDINDFNLKTKKEEFLKREKVEFYFTSFLEDLYEKYNNINISQSNVSTIIEKQTENDKEKEKQVQINTTRIVSNVFTNNINVNLCIIHNIDASNFIYFSINKKINYSMIILLYNNNKNNLYIIPIAYINTILKYNEYNDFINNFTIISIHNDNVFGYRIPDSHIKMLKILSKMLLEKHNGAIYLKKEELEFIRNNKDEYDTLIKTFIEPYNIDVNFFMSIKKNI